MTSIYYRLYTEAVKTINAVTQSTSYDIAEFAQHLYDTVTAETLPVSHKLPLLPSHTWHQSLRLVLTCPEDGLFTGNSRQNKMVRMLTIALTSEGVSCLPGRHDKSGKLTISHIVHLYSQTQARVKRQVIRSVEGSLPALGLSMMVSEFPAWLIESIQDWRTYIDPAINKRIPKSATADVVGSFRTLLDMSLTMDLSAEPFLQMTVIYAAVYRLLTYPPLFDLSNDIVKMHSGTGGTRKTRWVGAFFLKALTIQIAQSDYLEREGIVKAVNVVLAKCRIPWASYAMVGLADSLPGRGVSKDCGDFIGWQGPEMARKLRACVAYLNSKDRSLFQEAIKNNIELANTLYQQVELES
ncbi:hypothetical protein V1506DRAFT_550565 [Lipomyces tetrasporus]